MEKIDSPKVVVRYRDGRVVKGHTQDFFPGKPGFHVRPFEANSPGESVTVSFADLKAVFFVKDFAGNPQYVKKRSIEGPKPQGRLVEVTFRDGEILVGTTTGYDPKRPGFFVFPVDTQGNNIRAYLVSSAVGAVRDL
jgi:small nuclear ribonucleoprotein (snRNP)-like protein